MLGFATAYAEHYDLFYSHKDYPGECDFIEEVLTKYSNQRPSRILDVGCGTGGHALRLAERGYEILGIDLSEDMLRIAKAKAKAQGDACVRFQRSDARALDLQESFDVCISMFAVMSYQTTNEDMLAALHGIREHLDLGGILLFDVWSGAAVLDTLPAVRIHEHKKGDERVFRLVQPALDHMSHTVEVEYDVLVIRHDGVAEEAKETHLMRYWFPEELRLFLNVCGFSLLEICPFLRIGQSPSIDDWNIAVIARAT